MQWIFNTKEVRNENELQANLYLKNKADSGNLKNIVTIDSSENPWVSMKAGEFSLQHLIKYFESKTVLSLWNSKKKDLHHSLDLKPANIVCFFQKEYNDSPRFELIDIEIPPQEENKSHEKIKNIPIYT